MNRQQKRAALREVAKTAGKVKRGTATVNEVRNLHSGIQSLQKVGVLPSTKKRHFFARAWNFLKRSLGGQLVYNIRSK